MPFYTIKFKVFPKHKIGAPFPIDMLRYDHCYPDSETDSHMIQRSITHEGEDSTGYIDKITMVRLDRYRTWEPNLGRWESFGWSFDFRSKTVEKVNT